MAHVLVQIDNYSVYHYLGSIIRIMIYSATPSGNKTLGSIDFYPKDKVPKSFRTSAGFIFFYPIERFEEIMTTLRSEKPVSANFSYDEATTFITEGYLQTGIEPVGEQEGK